ncbi:AraC family transcriptional regulator [Conexibacter sp. CPCC 206217]|uniref:AraC family transcriptional regulator n=1 Tax=Conexibacter sp. CPCC 206217 TaxID=3064574 RepID=UPI00271D7EBE|nr:AraC family transcriptional regulator [Conexibacter sp. CPCC 206217]MDO8211748.1 AraC family transcriptional regulator [Conexibacter sp. CPCC 206217]
MRDRPTSTADPLSDVLDLLRVERAVSAVLEAGGAWAVRFPPYAHVKFSAVLRGSCWLVADGVAEPVRLHAGDAYLLADGAPYVLASDLGLEPVEAGPIFERARAEGRAARVGDQACGGHPDLVISGGGFSFDARNAALLLDALPPLVVMRGDDPAAPRAAAVVRAAVELLAAERAQPSLGSGLMQERLADVLFLQALRVVVASGASPAQRGWLSALGDPQIGAALRLMHGEIARRWTVAELAAAVGMSRSSFAERFRRLVGAAPLDYLLQWRMRTAARALEDPARTVSSVAYAWGYTSDSAFSNAFKRVMGSAPAHYRRGDTLKGWRPRPDR